MNMDQLGRNAGAEIRRVTSHELATGIGLHQLQRKDLRRRRASVAMAVTVAALFVVLGWRVLASLDGASGLGPTGPVQTLSPGPTDQVVAPDPLACNAVLECRGTDAYRLNLPVPVTYTLPPPTWALQTYTATTADFWTGSSYGVSVMENPVPAMNSRRAQVDPSGGTTARSMAGWMAARPFLVSTAVRETTVSGLPAWQVDVRLKAHQSTPALCGYGGDTPCDALVLMDLSGNRTVGIWGNGRIRWTFADLPQGMTVAVWTWDWDNDPGVFAPAQPLIDSMRFAGT